MRENLFTIAPDAPFLPTLARAIADGTLLSGWRADGPFRLADVTIFLPTRRARLALAEAFLKLGDGLLPDIRALGGEDETAAPFLPTGDGDPPPPEMPALERRLLLARLVAAQAKASGAAGGFATPPSAAEILRLADSLGDLLDDLAIEGVTASAVRGVAPENLAANWQQTLRFLDIALDAWPKMLASRGRIDRAARRNLTLARQAETAPLIYGDRPAIAAGSTGSIPATARLLEAIAALPRGAVVLPGLDTSLTADDFKRLADPAEALHAHPQYGLARLLVTLRALPETVTELGTPEQAARTHIVRQALAEPEATAGWPAGRAAVADEIAPAFSGVSVMAAPGEDLEARGIAVATREALAAHKTVGIVTPDRTLARRIAAELERFGIEVADAAGTPLFQSPAGRFARLALEVAAREFRPVPLLALLANRATTIGLERAEVARRAALLDMALLRQTTPAPGLDGLRRALDSHLRETEHRRGYRLSHSEGDALADLLDRLDKALAPLATLAASAEIDAAIFAAALAAAVSALSASEGEPATPPPGQPEFDAWATALAASDPGPRFRPDQLDAVLAALMAGLEVRETRPGRDDVAIWGQLEARLQSRDVMILAGLNEDVWPGAADPGPWLSRGMRLAAGLEPPERRLGQAAHDFEIALGGPAVLLAFAERRGTSPALASPLLQRLEAFLGEEQAKQLRKRGARWIDLARGIDRAAATRPARRPAPNPPVAARPRQLSITEIETLFRSPYDTYARHVLGLSPLRPLGQDPDARDRGSIVHDIFGRFVQEQRDIMAPDAMTVLDRMAEEAFAKLATIGERRDIWQRRFRRAAELFLAFERERQPRVCARHAEITGEWTFPLRGGFLLKGRADRVDEMADGGIEIIDFKTGSVPTPGQMKDYFAPQLPLEAELARLGGFKAVPAADAATLTYVKIGLGPDAFRPIPYALRDGETLAGAVAAVAQRMQLQVDALLLTQKPMPAQVLPLPNKRYAGDYDHLARVDEWAVAEDEETW